ncbi:MAG: HlyD family efflux transporter periplasmic adaptor subunit [Gammaproteobacteria bacterium]|nr:HlyD family efflux transporter periplasmic adaptor subunit [Gammaproteobacteria bacterium]
MIKLKILFVPALLTVLTACEEPPLQAVGQLESDRIELVAEYSEVITSIDVNEGDSIQAGTIVLHQDTARIDLRIEESQANIRRIEAVLAEQLSGPRTETIDAAKANLYAAQIEHDYRANELERLAGLRERNLTSVESIDSAENFLKAAGARIALVSAQLAELQAGTRPEQIEQTNGQLAQASAQLASLQLNKQRLLITSTTGGIVDSLLFETGERPRIGDVVAVLLSGEQPYARLYIPEPMRVQIRRGSKLQIAVDGLPGTLTGTVRRIESEATFTPYFALNERDRTRLSYVAEVSLPTLPDRLPDGIPVQAVF